MNSTRLGVLHITPRVGQGSTGLGSLTLDLARSQNSLGCDARIWCLDNHADIQWASASSGLQAEKIRGFESTGLGIPGLSLEMERAAGSAKNGDVTAVHQHGMWSGISRVTNILRKVHGVSTIIAPQGSLQQWALNKSRWKKKIAVVLYERSNLHNAACLHAVSENEIRECRDFGLSNPVALIPNGISHDWLNSHGDGENFRHKFNIPSDRRILLFLSRVTPKKGLLMFLESLDQIRKDLTDWQFVIAGADEFAHQVDIERFIEKKELKRFVKFVGPLYDQLKRDAYAAADLFVLPSLSEGAPVVILEALAAEVPVLATKASPWQDLQTHGCGWWVDISTDAISAALKDAVACSQEHLKLLGRRGRELVAAKYTWAKSAQMTIELYDWLLEKRQRPEFVVTD